MQQAAKSKTITSLDLAKVVNTNHYNVKNYVLTLQRQGAIEEHCLRSIRTKAGKKAIVCDLEVGGTAHRAVVSRYCPGLYISLFDDASAAHLADETAPQSDFNVANTAQLTATVRNLEAEVTALQQKVASLTASDGTDLSAFGQLVRRLTEHETRIKNLEKQFMVQNDSKIDMVRKFLDLLN